jgi:hypothetical protein
LLHPFTVFFFFSPVGIVSLLKMADGPRRVKFAPVKGDRWRHETVQDHISMPVIAQLEGLGIETLRHQTNLTYHSKGNGKDCKQSRQMSLYYMTRLTLSYM